jgi:hypothetical protein
VTSRDQVLVTVTIFSQKLVTIVTHDRDRESWRSRQYLVLMIVFIYLKLVRYVKGMSRRITFINTLSRAHRELKMVQCTSILVTIIAAIGFPYVLFIIMSLFNSTRKYHFRIAYMFIDVPLIFEMIALFQFTDSLKEFIMKKIKQRSIMVVRMT